MQTSSTVPFLAALNHVLVNEPENIGLADSDLFFLANNACQPHEQLLYEDYYKYTNTSAGRAELANAEVFGKVELLIKTELVKFKQSINKEVLEDKPTWRRLSWMLGSREKQQQLEHKRMALLIKEESNLAPEEPIGIVEQEPVPVVIEEVCAKPATTAVDIAPKSSAPQYDLTTPLNEKWKKRFRPDWPWYIEETNILHLTLAQLREIEAEIAAEKAEGINHPNDRFGYIPKGDLYDEGFFTFTSNGGTIRLPNCTYRPLIHLKESIRNTMAEQLQLGLVKANSR